MSKIITLEIKNNENILIELNFSEIKFIINSFFKKTAKHMIEKAQIKSAILSAITVPRVLSKGMFSYLEIIVALATSPARGTLKLIKQADNTAKKLFK